MRMPAGRASWPAEALEAAGRLTIDLAAITDNWRNLAARARGAETAACVKADAYGLGIDAVVPALTAAGCRTFFVALLAEARRVRAAAPDATIYVLGGFHPHTGPAYVETGARPVLGSLAEISDWAGFCRTAGARLPAAVHIDTGMNRLGLSREECLALPPPDDLARVFEVSLVMSHLACADTPNHPLTREQRDRFEILRHRLPPAPASLANSAGLLSDPALHYDMTRPGIAIYGGLAVTGRPNPMRPVVRLEARVVQLRTISAGSSVGYGAAQTVRRDTRLAILSAGYADGYMRAAGSTDLRAGATVYFGEDAAPLVGRISMDLIAADVTDIPEDRIVAGSWAELLGDRFTVDDLAARAGTIGYEILTGLGHRYRRDYIEA
ncbi:alanine racemase [Tepidamorphus gemmatus]|nr:alanine racemase [Tepidamorphus gemmatus]